MKKKKLSDVLTTIGLQTSIFCIRVHSPLEYIQLNAITAQKSLGRLRSHALTLLAPAHTPQNSPNNIQKPEPNNESGEEKIAKSGNENHDGTMMKNTTKKNNGNTLHKQLQDSKLQKHEQVRMRNKMQHSARYSLIAYILNQNQQQHERKNKNCEWILYTIFFVILLMSDDTLLDLSRCCFLLICPIILNCRCAQIV